MSRSQGLERFLGCLNGWTCESALPLGPERTQIPSLHCHSALNATRGTFTIEWQCELHCHSALSVPIALPLGLDRTDLVRSRPFGSPGRTATWPRACPDPIPSLPLGIDRTDCAATRP